MKALSKTRLLAYRQCPKRLWLEVHRPELRADSQATQANFRTGHQVGDIARRLYDPAGKGAVIDLGVGRVAQALSQTRALLQSRRPIFEAGFETGGVRAFADVLLPVRRGGKRAWRMVEVKSSTELKDYHYEDAAIQAFVARASGLPLAGLGLAHIDSAWTYPGHEDYDGLLVEHDLTEESFGRKADVQEWVSGAQRVVAKRKEPIATTGQHCTDPYECGFSAYCRSQEPQAEHPIRWLPDVRSNALKSHIEAGGITEMRDVPDDLLNERQLRVKSTSLSGKAWFDRQGAAQALAAHKLPACFIDFETIRFAVPIWKGTRPYQQIPFQFSAHRLSRTGRLEQRAFLDLSGKDPSRAFAEALIAAGGTRGPVYVYNSVFEKGRIEELAQRFARLATGLRALAERIVDLLPIARAHYYHPSQQGSWSIKAVLPALFPELRYDQLDGVQDGGMAGDAYLEAIDPQTATSRKAEIERQLLEYCALDTYAMVKLWSAFTGTNVKG